jgi:hypothetical protein
MHQISRNNGIDFQTGKNSGNHTVKTTLTYITHTVQCLRKINVYSLSISISYLVNIMK